MSVEKMKMLQIVGRLDRFNNIVGKLVQEDLIYFVDAMKMIENYSFTMNAQNKNLERTIDFNNVTNFERDEQYDEIDAKLDEFFELFSISPKSLRSGKLTDVHEIKGILDKVNLANEKIEEIEYNINSLNAESETLRLLDANDISVRDLNTLKNFKYAYGTISNMGRKRIKSNYSNIPGAVIHLGTMAQEEAYLLIYPTKVSEEISRVKDSLNWKEIPMIEEKELENYQLRNAYTERHKSLKEQHNALNHEIGKMLNENIDALADAKYTIDFMRILENSKAYIARSSKYFYLAGWVSEKNLAEIKTELSGEEDILLKVLNDDEVSLKPPTKLKNNFLFRPFEALIHMYGTPNYHEIDPTPFFAITYMILFGAMFGDLGQGAVFALAGFILTKKRHPNLGGVLLRIGLSSMIFGLLYGAVFGNEHLIPALLIKPFDNINTVLIAAIAFGVILTSFAYIIGIINKLKVNDIEEGVFGKEGIAGFTLFLSFIFLVLNIINIIPIPAFILILLMILCIALIILKQPLAHKIKNITPLYEDSAGDYYVESAFSIIEALLAIFSGTISFIRVGAFAINHVGLFMAFETMGEMMGGSGHLIILIIGNIVILGLEGLIVFIQSLRLEYYELFSKYYEGDGIPYEQNLKRI